MAVAFDAATESHTGTTGDASHASFTWNHTGGASARAALVYVFSIGALTDTSVTYGGATMGAVPYTGADTDTEPGAVRAYFLDNVATGTQAVVVNRTNNAVVMYAVAFTVTAATATEVYNPGVKTAGGSTSNTAASSSGTGTGTLALLSIDDGSPGTNSLRFMGRYQGTSNVTAAGAGSTAGPSIDFGLFVIDTFYETTAGQGARNVGGATITDDVAAIALAVRELARTSVNAGLASITTTASGPTDHLADFPTAASLATTAWQPTASEGVLPTAASLATTARAPTASEGVLPTVASLSVTGRDTTVQTLTITSVNAELASITATASGPAPSEGAEPGVSAASLIAQAPTASEGAGAGAAAATLTAGGAAAALNTPAAVASISTTSLAGTPSLGASAEAAALTTTAQTPTISLHVPAEIASLVVAAYNAAIDTSGGGGPTVSVSAENAGHGGFESGGFDRDGLWIGLRVAAHDATVAIVQVDTTVRHRGGLPLNAATVIGPSRRRVPSVKVNAQLASVGLWAHSAYPVWNDDETSILLLLEAL